MSAALTAAIYIVAVGLADGRAADRAAMLEDGAEARASALFSPLIAALNPRTLGVLALLTTCASVHRFGVRGGLAEAVLLAGANGTTYSLERALGAIDPLGAEGQRALGAGFFPSGHATAAMSLALALVLVARAPWVRRVTLASGAYAATVGVGLVATQNHHVSDVLGGFLIASAWGSIATTVMPGPGRRTYARAWRLGAGGPRLALGAALASGLTAAALNVPLPALLAFVPGSAIVISAALAIAGAQARRSPRTTVESEPR